MPLSRCRPHFDHRPDHKAFTEAFCRQQKELGELNGHVEEMHGGACDRKRLAEKESIARFEQINDRLYEAGWKAQFISG